MIFQNIPNDSLCFKFTKYSHFPIWAKTPNLKLVETCSNLYWVDITGWTPRLFWFDFINIWSPLCFTILICTKISISRFHSRTKINNFSFSSTKDASMWKLVSSTVFSELNSFSKRGSNVKKMNGNIIWFNGKKNRYIKTPLVSKIE